MIALQTRVKIVEHVRMVSTATRVLVERVTLGTTVRQVSNYLFLIEYEVNAINYDPVIYSFLKNFLSFFKNQEERTELQALE